MIKKCSYSGVATLRAAHPGPALGSPEGLMCNLRRALAEVRDVQCSQLTALGKPSVDPNWGGRADPWLLVDIAAARGLLLSTVTHELPRTTLRLASTKYTGLMVSIIFTLALAVTFT